MNGRARKQRTAVAAQPEVSEVHVSELGDGLRFRLFTADGVRVKVETLDPARDAVAADLAARLHAVSSIPPAPPRIEAWGPGQFDRVRLGPGVEAWIRITPEGRVRLVTPGGDLDVTDGGSALGTGLHEATTRAAQIRVRFRERATARAERLGHDLSGDPGDPVRPANAAACRRCAATGEFGTDGKARGAIFTARCGS